jgi:hypothetical protein
MMVEQVERDKPEVFKSAKDNVKALVFRDARLGTIDADLATAEKHLNLVLAKHAAIDKLEVLSELKAAEDFQRALEAEAKLVLRSKQKNERRHMAVAEAETKDVIDSIKAAAEKLRVGAIEEVVMAREKRDMEGWDFDAGDYIHEVGVVGDGPKERAHVRRCFHTLGENRSAPGDIGWEELPLLLKKCGLHGLDDEKKCEAIANIEFDPMYGRRPDRIKVR